MNLARERGVPVRKEERHILDRIAEGAVHQGIIAVASAFEYAEFETLFKSEKPIVVVLDGVEDPHNLGAVIRTAEALQRVRCCGSRAAFGAAHGHGHKSIGRSVGLPSGCSR